PALNMPGSPRKTCTRTSASSSPPVSAPAIDEYMARVSAFFLSGRFMRMIWTAPRRSIRTCSVTVPTPLVAIGSDEQPAGRCQACRACQHAVGQGARLAEQVFGEEAAERDPLFVATAQPAPRQMGAAGGERNQPQIGGG